MVGVWKANRLSGRSLATISAMFQNDIQCRDVPI